MHVSTLIVLWLIGGAYALSITRRSLAIGAAASAGAAPFASPAQQGVRQSHFLAACGARALRRGRMGPVFCDNYERVSLCAGALTLLLIGAGFLGGIDLKPLLGAPQAHILGAADP